MKIAFIIYLFLALNLTSCSKEWSITEQKTYMKDCLQFSEDPAQRETCECGLKKAMETYNSLEEAQKAIQNMKEEEVEAFFAECF